MKNNKNYLLLFKSIPFFTELNDEEIIYFLNHAREEEYVKTQSLFCYGDAADKFFIVKEGWIKLFRHNSEGKETVIAIVTKGDVFCEVSTFEGSDYPYSAQIVGGNAKCFVIPAHIIREKVRNNPNIALKMLSSLSHHNNQLGLVFEQVTKLTTAQRIGCFLLKLSWDRKNATTLQLPYNKLLIASRLGMQPETFSRALKRLKDDLNITIKGREINIPNIQSLQKYCDIFCNKNTECNIENKLLCTNPYCDIYRILQFM